MFEWSEEERKEHEERRKASEEFRKKLEDLSKAIADLISENDVNIPAAERALDRALEIIRDTTIAKA